MDQQQPRGFTEDLASIVSSPPALLGLLVLMAFSGGQAMLVTARMPELAASIGMARVGMLLTSLTLFQAIISFIVFAVLSRKLGSPDGRAGEANVGAWIGFAILYFLIVFAVNMVVSMSAYKLAQQSMWLYPLVAGFAGLVVRVMLFLLLVQMVSLAHDRDGPGFSAISQYLTVTRPGIYGGYVLLCLLVALLPALSLLVRTGEGTQVGIGVYLVIGLISAFTQLLLFCYAIAAYRAVAGGKGSGDVFS